MSIKLTCKKKKNRNRKHLKSVWWQRFSLSLPGLQNRALGNKTSYKNSAQPAVRSPPHSYRVWDFLQPSRCFSELVVGPLHRDDVMPFSSGNFSGINPFLILSCSTCSIFCFQNSYELEVELVQAIIFSFISFSPFVLFFSARIFPISSSNFSNEMLKKRYLHFHFHDLFLVLLLFLFFLFFFFNYGKIPGT